MPEVYSAGDILEMAAQAKAKAVNLYMTLARSSENYYVSQLFAELAKDETKHKFEILKWKGSIKEASNEAYPGERSLFLKFLVEQNTFNCDAALQKALKTTVNEEDALRAGIDFEKDFMLFLHELKRSVSGGAVEVIDKLIDDEIKHMKHIFSIKDKLEKGE